MFLWINLHDQDLISAWYGKHGLCLLLCLFYHDTVSLCEVFRREVFPSYTSWVASKKSASLSKPKMTQVVKWMPVLKKRKSFPFAHVRKFTWKKKDIFFTFTHVGKRCPAFHSRKPRPTPLLEARDVGLDLVSTNVFKKNVFKKKKLKKNYFKGKRIWM